MTNKIMIAVDLQEDFVDGILGSKTAQKIIPTAADAIRNFDGHTIIYTLDTHEQPFYTGTIESEKIPFHCPYGEAGWKKIEQNFYNYQISRYNMADPFSHDEFDTGTEFIFYM